MKQVWVKVDPWDKDIAIAALESGADALVLPPGHSAEAKKLGVIRTVAADGDLKPGTDVFMVEIASKDDELRIARLAPDKPVIVTTRDWTIIPLENLIAQRQNIFLEVATLADAQTPWRFWRGELTALLSTTGDEAELRKIIAALKEEGRTAVVWRKRQSPGCCRLPWATGSALIPARRWVLARACSSATAAAACSWCTPSRLKTRTSRRGRSG